MSKDYKILQIGIDNWTHHYEIPENMDWYYFCPNSPLALSENDGNGRDKQIFMLS